MKFDFKKLANRAIAIAAPVLVAALTHKVLTGKLDIKGAALDALDRAVDRASNQAGA